MFTLRFCTVEFAILIFIRSEMISACLIIQWFLGILIDNIYNIAKALSFSVFFIFLYVDLVIIFCELQT